VPAPSEPLTSVAHLVTARGCHLRPVQPDAVAVRFLMAARDHRNGVLGFRVWRTHDPHALMSMNRDGFVWQPGVTRMRCSLPAPLTHRAPNGQNDHAHMHRCGLYAFHRPEFALRRGGANDVYGAVVARGLVQVHAHGWRAPEVAIVALAAHPALAPGDPRIGHTRQLAARYGVPLLPFDALGMEGSIHADTVESSDLPTDRDLRLAVTRRMQASVGWCAATGVCGSVLALVPWRTRWPAASAVAMWPVSAAALLAAASFGYSAHNDWARLKTSPDTRGGW
jgi:hypothetical protein